MTKKKQLFDDELRNSLQVSLHTLREKKPKGLSRRELIENLKDDIRALHKDGFSFAEIAELLTDKGLQIAPTTLREYLKTRKSKKHKTGTDKAVNTTPTKQPINNKQPTVRTSAALNEDA